MGWNKHLMGVKKHLISGKKRGSVFKLTLVCVIRTSIPDTAPTGFSGFSFQSFGEWEVLDAGFTRLHCIVRIK